MFSGVKTRERELARALRRKGRSVREIERLVGVSRSSVSLWVRDIELTAEQIQALRLRDARFNAHRNGSAANAEKARARRAQFQERGRELARGAAPG
jgi:transposase